LTALAIQSNRLQNLFWVHWNMGKRCNYDCVYCPDNLHDMTSKHRSLDNLKEIFHRLNNNVAEWKKIRIWFTGGEPTVNPKFLDFCKWLKEEYPDRVATLGLNTNGSRTKSYYLELLQYVNKVQYSSHFQYLQDEKFMAILAASPRKKISLNLMMEPEYWDRAVKLVEFCEENNVNFHLKRIRPKSTWDSDNRKYSPYYTKEQIRWLETKEHTVLVDEETGVAHHKPDIFVYEDYDSGPQQMWSNDIIKREEDNYKGWSCGVGLEGLQIWVDGNITRGVCKVGGVIGHIDDEVWDLPNEFVICSKNRCSCAADMKNTRYKDETVRNLLKEEVRFKVQELRGDPTANNI